MAYRSKKWHIFGEKLNVPEDVLKRIYKKEATIDDFVSYDLVDKLPLDILSPYYQERAELYGFENAQKLDWEFIEKNDFAQNFLAFRDDDKDIVNNFDEECFKQITEGTYNRIYFTDRMRIHLMGKYPEIFADEFPSALKQKYYENTLTIFDIFDNYNLFQNKKFMHAITTKNENDYLLKEIEEDSVKLFTKLNSEILKYFKDETQVLNILIDLEDNSSSNSFLNFLKELDITYHLEDINILLKYLNITDLNLGQPEKEFLQRYQIKDLLNLNIDLINSSFDMKLMSFIKMAKLSNINRFDHKNNNYFKNCVFPNWEDFSTTYLEVIDLPELDYDSFQHYIYLLLKNSKNNLNYSQIKGEFRKEHPDIFLQNNIPDDLSNLYYTNKLLPTDIIKNNWYQYISNIKISNIFASNYIIDTYSKKKELLLDYIENNLGLRDGIIFIDNYYEYLSQINKQYIFEMEIKEYSTKEALVEQLDTYIITEIMLDKLPLKNSLPLSIKENYQSLFINNNAPLLLKENYYNKTINGELLKSNPSFYNYLHDKELFKALTKEYQVLENNMTDNTALFILTKYGSEILNIKHLIDLILKEDDEEAIRKLLFDEQFILTIFNKPKAFLKLLNMQKIGFEINKLDPIILEKFMNNFIDSQTNLLTINTINNKVSNSYYNIDNELVKTYLLSDYNSSLKIELENYQYLKSICIENIDLFNSLLEDDLSLENDFNNTGLFLRVIQEVQPKNINSIYLLPKIIDKMNKHFSNVDNKELTKLVNKIISGEVSAGSLQYIDSNLTIKYCLLVDNIYSKNDAKFINDNLRLKVINNIKKENILSILENISKSDIKASKQIEVAYKLYFSLPEYIIGHLLEVNDSKNYGYITYELLNKLLSFVNIKDINHDKIGPNINEELMNIIFGKSYKVLNTPIRNLLNDNSDINLLLKREIKKIDETNLSEDVKIKKRKQIEEAANRHIINSNKFIELLPVIYYNWTAINNELSNSLNIYSLKPNIRDLVRIATYIKDKKEGKITSIENDDLHRIQIEIIRLVNKDEYNKEDLLKLQNEYIALYKKVLKEVK